TTSIIRNMFFYQYIKPEVATWFDDLCLTASGWGTLKSLVSLRDERLFDDLKNITIPTLILHGIADKIVPFPCAEYMHENIKDSELVSILNGGHGAFFENKDRVSSAINDFDRYGKVE
ncbi:MAG: alpha/beta fold hydrolase, partial [Turicibacter sp.]